MNEISVLFETSVNVQQVLLLLLHKHMDGVTELSTTEIWQHWHFGETRVNTSGRCVQDHGRIQCNRMDADET